MFNRNRYAGQPLDDSSRRSITILGDANPEIGDDDATVTLGDFYHVGTFWNAVVPLDAVNEVFGQAFNFSKPKTKPGPDGPEIVRDKQGVPKRTVRMLNHVQSRFTLKMGHYVELFSSERDPSGEPEHRVDDFVYSLEAVGPVGVTFNIRDGLAGNLFSAHRFMSTQEMVFERIVVQSQYVTESPALPIDEREKRALLIQSLLRSHCAGANEQYYLYRFCGTNNCTSNPFQILDRVVDYSLLQRVGSQIYRLPLNPRFYLRMRGLDVDPTVRKLVRDEFEDYIGDPVTQQRKRDYVRSQTRALRAARKANVAT